jgi:hypothetical protein
LAAAWPQLVELDVPMSEHTTFRIGGPADALAVPTTIPELKELLQFCAKQQLPIMVIGRGSNLLVRDGGLRAVVIKIADAMSTVALKEDGLQAEAGISLAALSPHCGFGRLWWSGVCLGYSRHPGRGADDERRCLRGHYAGCGATGHRIGQRR